MTRQLVTMTLVGACAIGAFSIYAMQHRMGQMEDENLELRGNLSAYHTALEVSQARTLQRIHELECGSKQSLDETVRALHRRDSESGAAFLDKSKRLVTQLAERERHAREAILLELKKTRSQILDLRAGIEKSQKDLTRREQIFREIQESSIGPSS